MHKTSRTIKRRRTECKTDYRRRLILLKSNRPRLVVRKTNKFIIAQIVSSEIAQDKVIINVTSKDLLQSGWPKENVGSLKSRAAAYLTGFLIGTKAKGKLKEAILDLGMHRSLAGSRIYSVVKGVIDAGVNVPCDESYLPELETIKNNEKVAKIFDKIKQNIGGK